jgi:hypothetical protein
VENHFDGARERLGHGSIEARGKGFERCGLRADQRCRAKSTGFTVVGIGLGHRLLMVTKDRE